MFLLRILARDFDQYSSNLRKLILKPFRHQKQIDRRILGFFYLKAICEIAPGRRRRV
jgi:hypothetical protein